MVRSANLHVPVAYLPRNFTYQNNPYSFVPGQVTVGRFPDNNVFIEDREVSGKHALLNWDSERWSWQARDMGSMNGTRLNGNFISNAARRPGKHYRLSSDDILLLGSRTAIKVTFTKGDQKTFTQLCKNLLCGCYRT